MSSRVVTKITNRLGVLAAIGAALYLALTIAQPMRLNWGDPWSDGNAMTSGRFFARYGFVATRFTPILDLQPLRPDSLRYMHYPPLPDLLNGVEQKLFGSADISVFRIFAVLLSLAGLFFFFRFTREVWGPRAANIALALMGTSLLWLEYADTIHHIPIYWSAGFASLYWATHWLRDQNRRSLWLVFGATLICFLGSYDFGLFLPIMAAASAVLLGRRLTERVTIQLLSVIVAAGILFIGIKSGLAIWAVGWAAFRDDVLFQLHERSTAQHSLPYHVGLPIVVVLRLWRYFGPVFFAAIFVQTWVLLRRLLPKRVTGDSARLWNSSPLIVLLAGIPFIIVFTQLFVEQQHPSLAFVPYYAIGGGVFIAQCLSASTRPLRLAGAAALVLAIAWQMVAVGRFQKTFLERDEIARVRDFLDANDHHDFVLSNSGVDSPFRYYWNRHLIGIGEIKRAPFLDYVRGMFEEFGPSDIHFIHFSNIERHLFDKGVFSWFGPMGHWDWVADPGAHKREWEPIARRMDDELVAVLRSSARLRVDAGGVQVYSFSRNDLVKPTVSDRELVAEPTPRHIDFGTVESEKYKIDGFGPHERNKDGDGFCWMHLTQRKRLQFTVRGLNSIPDGRARTAGSLRLNLPPGRTYRVRISTMTGVPQTLRIRVNDSPVIGELVFEEAGKRNDLVFDLPAQYLSASGLQVIKFDYERAYDEWGLAVVLFTLDISDGPEGFATGEKSLQRL